MVTFLFVKYIFFQIESFSTRSLYLVKAFRPGNIKSTKASKQSRTSEASMATNGTEVYIKLPTGRSSRYDIYPSQVIRTLCERVAQEENVKANQVSLKYQGKILDPSKTVSHYGVRVETILKAEVSRWI